jgi:membrane fusion protein (multidrug efflux system)
MNRNKRHLLTAAVLAVALTAAGCGNQVEAVSPAQRALPEVAVLVVEPEALTLTTELSGRTTPHRVAEVRPQVGGILQKRLFTEGSEVQEGEVLYQIDPATYQAAYASARAALAKAEANLMPARLRAERYRGLVSIKAVSQQEHDDAVAAQMLAEAELEAARAALEVARINLDYTSLKAPISGRIGRSTMTTGALVTANQVQALATIQQLDPIYVDVTQSSSDLLQLKRNIANGMLQSAKPEQAQVSLRLEDGSAYPLPGTLKFSEVAVDPSTGSVTLRTIFPNPDQLLLPGMFVRAIIEEGVNEQAILVPQRGVTRNPTGSAMVMIVDAEEKVAARVIKVVRTVGDKWLVSEGLQAGDRVILEGTQKARPGTPVKVVPFEGPAATGQPQATSN